MITNLWRSHSYGSADSKVYFYNCTRNVVIVRSYAAKLDNDLLLNYKDLLLLLLGIFNLLVIPYILPSCFRFLFSSKYFNSSHKSCWLNFMHLAEKQNKTVLSLHHLASLLFLF